MSYSSEKRIVDPWSKTWRFWNRCVCLFSPCGIAFEGTFLVAVASAILNGLIGECVRGGGGKCCLVTMANEPSVHGDECNCWDVVVVGLGVLWTVRWFYFQTISLTKELLSEDMIERVLSLGGNHPHIKDLPVRISYLFSKCPMHVPFFDPVSLPAASPVSNRCVL